MLSFLQKLQAHITAATKCCSHPQHAIAAAAAALPPTPHPVCPPSVPRPAPLPPPPTPPQHNTKKQQNIASYHHTQLVGLLPCIQHHCKPHHRHPHHNKQKATKKLSTPQLTQLVGLLACVQRCCAEEPRQLPRKRRGAVVTGCLQRSALHLAHHTHLVLTWWIDSSSTEARHRLFVSKAASTSTQNEAWQQHQQQHRPCSAQLAATAPTDGA